MKSHRQIRSAHRASIPDHLLQSLFHFRIRNANFLQLKTVLILIIEVSNEFNQVLETESYAVVHSTFETVVKNANLCFKQVPSNEIKKEFNSNCKTDQQVDSYRIKT